jgi:hypothetical protein
MSWERVSWFAGKGRTIVFAGPPSHFRLVPRPEPQLELYDQDAEVEDDPTPPHGTERP